MKVGDKIIVNEIRLSAGTVMGVVPFKAVIIRRREKPDDTIWDWEVEETKRLKGLTWWVCEKDCRLVHHQMKFAFMEER